MSRLALTVLLVFLIFTFDLTSAAPAENHWISQGIEQKPTLVCGNNSERLNYRSHLSCYSNCDNRHTDPTVECIKTIHFVDFCACKDGYIFREGTKGDCIRPHQCPLPPKTAMYTLPLSAGSQLNVCSRLFRRRRDY